ncbi:MAG: caspase family protein [Pseudorhodoplanes sp.]|uniref:caspase family protein n=1 Tax=Pseudorhodoplanes sp. TaxID=1934341 RepID=UPI003D09AE4D
MWRAVFVALSLFAAQSLIMPGPAGAQSVDDGKACTNGNTPADIAIAACGRVIASGRYKGEQLALLHAFRSLAFRRNRDYDRAIADLSSAMRINPKAAATYHDARSLVYRDKGDFDRAIAEADAAIRINPNNPSHAKSRALAHRAKGAHAAAAADFSTVIRLDPNDAAAYQWRAEAYYRIRKYNDAIPDMDKAIALDPTNAGFYNQRGTTRRSLDRWTDAIRDYDEAIRLDPNLAGAYLGRGISHRALGQFDNAIRDYDQAIRLDPKNGLGYYHRAISLQLSNRFEDAYRDIVQAIALDPQHKESVKERDHIRGLMANVASKTTTAATQPPIVPAPAASAVQGGPRVALVIGNGKYRTAPELANPANDARDVSAALRALGFKVIEGYDLDSAGMRAKIGEFGAAMQGAATTLFFYAGHGVQVAGNNYLIPTDARLERPSALSTEAIAVDTILSDMETEKRINLVFLDACRDNPLSRSLARAFGGGARSAAVGQGLAQLNAGIGTLITFATSPNRIALDGTGRNSPFTAALLKHIHTPNLEVRTLLTRVRADVIRETNERQVPWDHSSLTGEFYFRRGG